jgi:hypothetical protein
MADRPQQLRRNIGVARNRAIRLDAVSDQLIVDVRGDDLRIAPSRLQVHSIVPPSVSVALWRSHRIGAPRPI